MKRPAKRTKNGGWGILPDVVVPLDEAGRTKIEKAFTNQEAEPWGEAPPFEEVPADWVDPQLARAIDLLQGRLVLQKIRDLRAEGGEDR